MTRRRAICIAVILLLAGGALPMAFAQGDLPRASEVVKARASVTPNPVRRGQTFEVTVVAEILSGFHINANKVLQDYLIPTKLEADLPAGLRLAGIAYPPGELKKFEFSEEKLAVYEGRVTLRMRVQALPNAPKGKFKLPLSLRYQACNDKTCLPPVSIPVPVELETAAGSERDKAGSTRP